MSDLHRANVAKLASLGIGVPVKRWEGANEHVTPDVSASLPGLVSAGVSSKKGLRVGEKTTLHPRIGWGLFGPTLGVSVRRKQAEDPEQKKDMKKTAMHGFFDELGKIAETI